MTPEMQALWNRAMLLFHSRTSYGRALPMPGTRYPLPLSGTPPYDLCFTAVASPSEYETELAAVRADMEAWKVRIRSKGHAALAVDISKIDFTI